MWGNATGTDRNAIASTTSHPTITKEATAFNVSVSLLNDTRDRHGPQRCHYIQLGRSR